MIQTKLGTVRLTQPNYELCELLHCTKEDVDVSVKAGLVVDLGTILKALELQYDIETALDMWSRAAEYVTEDILKGEQNNDDN